MSCGFAADGVVKLAAQSCNLWPGNASGPDPDGPGLSLRCSGC